MIVHRIFRTILEVAITTIITPIIQGWQHWGQVMGNPLYRSPIYNTDGSIQVLNNRFVAYHLGFDGMPTERFGYRVLGTFRERMGYL